MHIKVVFNSTHALDLFVGKLQKFGDTSTQIVFSTIIEPRQVDVLKLSKSENKL